MSRPKFRQEVIDDLLRKLHSAVQGITASVVVNRDGLLVAPFPPGDDSDPLVNATSSPQVAAISATLIRLAVRTFGRLEQGELELLLMVREEYVICAYPAGLASLSVS